MSGYVAVFNRTGSAMQSWLNGVQLSQLPPQPAQPDAPPALLRIPRVQTPEPVDPVFGTYNRFEAQFPDGIPAGLDYAVDLEISPKRYPLTSLLQLYLTYGAVVLSCDGEVVSYHAVAQRPAPTTTG